MRNELSIYESLSKEAIYDSLTTDLDVVEQADENVKMVLGLSSSQVPHTRALEAFAAAVLRDDSLGYMLLSFSKDGNPNLKQLPLARFYRAVMSCSSLAGGVHRFSEEVELIIATAIAEGATTELIQSPSTPTSDGLSYGYEIFNNIIQALRVHLTSSSFKTALKRRAERARRQYKSSVKYVHRLFKNRSRYVILRVDFGYRSGLTTRSNGISKIDLARARADLKRFQNNMRSTLMLKDVLGLIWKLEYGKTKGYHFHLVLFCDSSEVLKDAYLAQQICDYWVKNITKGEGVAFNCNRSKRKYRYCGIGTVHETEADSMRGLLMALTYITKSDQYVSIRDVRVRCFGHWVEKPRTTKRGRPRTRTARDERAQFTTDPMALAW